MSHPVRVLPPTRRELAEGLCLVLPLLAPPLFFLCWPWLAYTRWRRWRQEAIPVEDEFLRFLKSLGLAMLAGFTSLVSTSFMSLLGLCLWLILMG